MIELLIVDDEWSVLENLTQVVPWESAGISRVHTAASADQALRILEEQTIHILIADIQMPEMSGLELIDQAKRMDNRIRCLILSGHTEFEYAQEGLRLQVHDYLTKPIRNESLLQSVKRLVESIRSERNDVTSNQRMHYTLRENLPYLQARLLDELIMKGDHAGAIHEEQLSMLELPFSSNTIYNMALIRLGGSIAKFNAQDSALIEYGVKNIADEMLGEEFQLWHGKDAHENMVMLVTPRTAGLDADEGNNRLLRHMNGFQQKVHFYLKCSMTAIIGEWQPFPKGIGDIYDRLVRTMLRRAANDEHIVFFHRHEAADSIITSAPLLSLNQPPMLLALLDAGRWAEAEKKLIGLFDEMRSKGASSPEHLFMAYAHISGAYISFCHQNDQFFKDLAGSGSYLSGHSHRSLVQLREWSLHGLRLLESGLRRTSDEDRLAIIRQVHQFLDTHLSKDVSLQAVADHVNLHPVYLSNVYKKLTGDNISEVILRRRMDMSAFLLKHTNEKIHVIAEKVGYPNSTYFAKVFRKYFGMTPLDYRNK